VIFLVEETTSCGTGTELAGDASTTGVLVVCLDFIRLGLSSVGFVVVVVVVVVGFRLGVVVFAIGVLRFSPGLVAEFVLGVVEVLGDLGWEVREFVGFVLGELGFVIGLLENTLGLGVLE